MDSQKNLNHPGSIARITIQSSSKLFARSTLIGDIYQLEEGLLGSDGVTFELRFQSIASQNGWTNGRYMKMNCPHV
ncbi:MAG: hypothetical protein LBI69_02320 [Puniceicoccales bacterium]|jgi:hypothetical protein|nr:hypothetical protein [Puniceicoccales bacterium]